MRVFVPGLTLLLISTSLTGCAPQDSQDAQSGEPSVDALAAPLPQGGTLSASELSHRRDAIRAHFAGERARLPIVTTTVTDEGQTLDWVPAPEDAPSMDELVRANPGLAAAMARRAANRADGALPAQTVLALEPDARGPQGTVPVVRFDVESYLASEPNPPVDPTEVLQNLPPPASESNGGYYVAWKRAGVGPFGGAGARINIWDGSGPPALPTVESSITEVWVGNGSGNGQQTVEAGKVEMRSLNGGSAYPYLFVYYTTNNYTKTGDWLGGYNNSVAGWVQLSSTNVPGLPFANVSTRDGAQFYIDVWIIGPGGAGGDGRWYVVLNGAILGWYPRCKKGDTSSTCAASGFLFSSTGLRTTASGIQIYGEVGGQTLAAKSTDMGSGRFASEGWARAAYLQDVVAFLPGGGNAHFTSADTLRVTDSGCYSKSGPTFPPGSNLLYYGGPGSDVASCH